MIHCRVDLTGKENDQRRERKEEEWGGGGLFGICEKPPVSGQRARLACRHPLHVRTSLGSWRMIVRVVMSSATRVPGFSLDLSSLLRQPTT